VKSPNANGSQEELLKVNDKSFEQFVEAWHKLNCRSWSVQYVRP
jgi:hypothetical protein